MNTQYQNMLATILQGDPLITRNAPVRRAFLPEFQITSTPLITLRKTAWKKALREFEWFMSGDQRCPEELLDWWDGQLHDSGLYLYGYPTQFRGYYGDTHDQIATLLDGLKKHPNSRRHIVTTWKPYDMAHITELNENKKTPTTCHGSFVQFFVSSGKLHMYHYQRSADMLLGLPHNLMQYWAFLLYVAHHVGLYPGHITWKIGDSHIYDEPSHINAALEIVEADRFPDTAHLVYEPPVDLPDCHGIPEFRARDFKLIGDVPEPVCIIRPKLL